MRTTLWGLVSLGQRTTVEAALDQESLRNLHMGFNGFASRHYTPMGHGGRILGDNLILGWSTMARIQKCSV